MSSAYTFIDNFFKIPAGDESLVLWASGLFRYINDETVLNILMGIGEQYIIPSFSSDLVASLRDSLLAFHVSCLPRDGTSTSFLKVLPIIPLGFPFFAISFWLVHHCQGKVKDIPSIVQGKKPFFAK